MTAENDMICDEALVVSLSTHDQVKIPKHTHTTGEVQNVEEVVTRRPTARGIDASDVRIGNIAGLELFLNDFIDGYQTGDPLIDNDKFKELAVKLSNMIANKIIFPSKLYIHTMLFTFRTL